MKQHTAACNISQLLLVAAACMHNSYRLASMVAVVALPTARTPSKRAAVQTRQQHPTRPTATSGNAGCCVGSAVVSLVHVVLCSPAVASSGASAAPFAAKTASPGSFVLSWAKAYCKSLNRDALTCASSVLDCSTIGGGKGKSKK